MGDVCQFFGSISLLPNQFSWQHSFWHLLAKILIDTVLCWVTGAFVSVSPKQQKFLSGPQMHHQTYLKCFLSPLEAPKQQLFLVKKQIAAKRAGEGGRQIGGVSSRNQGDQKVLEEGKVESMNLVLGVCPHLGGEDAMLAQVHSSPSSALLGITEKAHPCRLHLLGLLVSSQAQPMGGTERILEGGKREVRVFPPFTLSSWLCLLQGSNSHQAGSPLSQPLKGTSSPWLLTESLLPSVPQA